MDRGSAASSLAPRRPSDNPSIQQSMVCLSLTLFVPGISANDPNDALATNDLAVLAELLN